MNINEIKGWRHHLHANPETAFEENKTSLFIKEKLLSWGIEVKEGFAKTGVVGVLKNGTSNKSVGLRADMDALNITEENNFDYASNVSGKMHACGHDGHTAMLLGAAKELADNKTDIDGTVYFIFQPAEEFGAGGQKMIDDGLFEECPADTVFALHNWPGLEEGHIAVKPGPMMASADEFYITVQGKGCHAAMPHIGIDPIVTAAKIITESQTIISRQTNPFHSAVLSFTQNNAGSAINIIPDKAFMAGTIRTLNAESRDFIKENLKKVAEGIASLNGASADFSFDETTYPLTENDPREAEFVANMATILFGKEKVHTDFDPGMAAEDFGYMLNEKPGAYIWLGQGKCWPIHSPKYDFNDNILETGVKLLTGIAKKKLAL